MAGKESPCSAGDLGSIPALGRSPGEEKGYPLPYPGLENSMDCIVHGVAKSQRGLSDFHFRHSAFFMVQLSHPYMATGKTTALTIWTFVSKVMSLFFFFLFVHHHRKDIMKNIQILKGPDENSNHEK